MKKITLKDIIDTLNSIIEKLDEEYKTYDIGYKKKIELSFEMNILNIIVSRLERFYDNDKSNVFKFIDKK